MAIGALVGIVGGTAANLIKNAYKNNERNKTNSSEDARLSSGIGSGGSKGSSLNASGKSSPTTIYGPDGSLNAGYISNGQTYFQDGTRIADGYSSVDNSGRVWTMRNGQGVLTGNIKDGWGGGNGFGNFSGGFDQGAGEYQSYIDEMRRQEEQAAYARAEAERAAVEASKNSLNQQYNDAARQAYILAEKQKRDIPNIMSAQGMSGGATESQLLTADTNYQNNINNLEAERMAALANLDVTGGDIDAALSQTLAGIGTNYNGLMLEYYRDQQQQAEENALRDRELFVNTIGQYSDDYQAQIDRLLAQGVPESDYRIMYLKAARAQKVADREAAEEERRQREFENNLALMRLRSGGSGGGEDLVYPMRERDAGDGGDIDGRIYTDYNPTVPMSDYADMLLTDIGQRFRARTLTAEGAVAMIERAQKNGYITEAEAENMQNSFLYGIE